MRIAGRAFFFVAAAGMAIGVPACFSFGDLSGGGGDGPGSSGDGGTTSDGTTTQTDGAISGTDGSTARTIVEIASGGNQACVVLSNGELWCWGGDDLGGLGIDPASAPASCTNAGVTLPCNPTPTKVAGIDDVVHVSAGAGQTCAIKKDNTLWCWGANEHGQLGHASGTAGDHACTNGLPCNPTPTEVADLPQMAEVSAGATFTCGVSTGGTGFCWGANFYGELGDTGSNRIDQPTPLQVGGAGFGDITQIATSGYGTTACALRTNKSVWCWGENTSGEAGHPPNTLNDEIDSPHYFTHTPKPVGEYSDAGTGAILSDATAITFAFGAGCALDLGGAPHCWGYSKWGMLGDVGNATYAFPSPVTIEGLSATFQSISGRWTNMCGTDSSGQVWCWGLNNFGELGIGNENDVSGTVTCDLSCQVFPVQAMGISAMLLSSNGATLAVRPNGTSIVGWGANYNGALGHAPGQNGDVQCPFGDASVACAPTPVDVYDFH